MDPQLSNGLRRLAETQEGRLSRDQLRGFVSDTVIRDWVASERLVRDRRGVYVLGHRLETPRGAWWSALLACGEEAFLSHGAAAAVWELAGWFDPIVDITSPRRIKHDGIRPHRSRLHPDDTAVHEPTGLRTTSIARILIDQAAGATYRKLERLVDQAEVRRLLSLNALTAALERAPRKPGTKALKAIIASTAPKAFTRSDLEEAFLALVRKAGLPEPVVNGYVLGLEVDFHWPQLKLIVETDGGPWHATPRRVQGDKRRDAELLVHGWRTLRFTDLDVMTRPDYVLGVLASMFSRM
jgi:very-short-patch-repair endonuclease